MRFPRIPAGQVTLLVGTLPLTIGLAACGSAEPNAVTDLKGVAGPTHDARGGAQPVIANLRIGNGAVNPTTVHVRPGETIWVINSDSTAHALADNRDQLSTGNIGPGGTATMAAPTRPGTFELTDPQKPSVHVSLLVA
jgi:plastocyanin